MIYIKRGEPRYAVVTPSGEFVDVSARCGDVIKIKTSDDLVSKISFSGTCGS
jgi:hypothetical protein